MGQHGVDAVLSHHPRVVLESARRLGLSVPRDLQVVNLSKAPQGLEAGILQPDRQVMRVAVDQLIQKLQHGARGFPDRRRTILVDGIWSPGWTVRPGENPVSAGVSGAVD